MNTEVATQNKPQQLAPADAFKKDLDRLESQIKMLLPSHVTVDKFNRVVMTAIRKNPALLNLEKNSLFGACMDAATDGLLPNGKEAALVPSKGKVRYTPMVAGILKMIRNSGELLSIGADVIKENDEFDYYTDEKGKHLKHKPKFGDRGKSIGAFCILITKDGGTYIEVMDKDQIETIRKRSPAGNDGPWITDPDEMWKKTVVKRTAKMAPLSTDVEEMMHRDDEANAILDKEIYSDVPEAPPVTPVAPAKAASKLSAAVGAKPASVAPRGQEQPMSMDPLDPGNVSSNSEVPI